MNVTYQFLHFIKLIKVHFSIVLNLLLDFIYSFERLLHFLIGFLVELLPILIKMKVLLTLDLHGFLDSDLAMKRLLVLVH